jgi:hypothetical protein
MAAFKKLFSLPGFRAKITSEKGGQGLLEFAQPNNYRFTVQAQGYGFETLHVGDKVASRRNMPGASPEWQCHAVKPSDKSLIDLVAQRATGTVSVSRGPDSVIDGTPVHTFVSTKESSKDTIYVSAQNGLPKRTVEEGGKNTIDYYDYGAHVVITPPPCAQ